MQINYTNHIIITSSLSGVKQPGHASDHSPPSSAKVKNEWDYTFTSPMTMACRGNNFVLHYCFVMLPTVSDL